MGYQDYKTSITIVSKGYSFYSIIMAAMRRADELNLGRLKRLWPDVYDEWKRRNKTPEGKLTQDDE